MRAASVMGWVPMALSVEETRRDSAATNKQIAEVVARGVKLR